MNTANNRTYMLVIKRDNNDYLPLEWNLLKLYNNENLNTLEGIDNFTKKLTKEDLLFELLMSNILYEDEKYKGFSIIFNEKGRTRELKDGTVFKEDADLLNPKNIIGFLNINKNNKNVLNNICNIIKDTNNKNIEFKYILKNIDKLAEKGEKTVKAALSTFENLDYIDRRTISIMIYNKYIKE